MVSYCGYDIMSAQSGFCKISLVNELQTPEEYCSFFCGQEIADDYNTVK
jgi:hypothetical protein